MKLKDLFKLETGDKVRLKGTDMVFEIVEFDEEDHKCPILVEWGSGSSTEIPAIHNFMGSDPMFVIPNSAVWFTRIRRVYADILRITKLVSVTSLKIIFF